MADRKGTSGPWYGASDGIKQIVIWVIRSNQKIAENETQF